MITLPQILKHHENTNEEKIHITEGVREAYNKGIIREA